MYSTCIFCHSSLGKNEAVEQFPIGRRLAFDGEKGRLWAVCAKCGRWNLTPIEERWEAIEGDQRGYQYTGLNQYPVQIRLAFEMASHEETERAALEEDLSQLEADWREAEEIASISDNMFLPQSITDFISRAKR